MKLNFCGPTYSNHDATERCVNLIPIISNKKVIRLIRTPGIEQLFNVGAPVCRGLYVVSKIETTALWGVFGDGFYRILPNWLYVRKGTLNTNSGPVSITDNGIDILIVDGSPYGYLHNLASDTFSQIADPDFVGSDTCTFQDGYFFTHDPGTNKVRASDLYDGTSWAALAFEGAEGDPDDVVRVLSDHQELWVYGALSTEVWRNAGLLNFPFQRVSGAVLEYGLTARWSLVKLDSAQYFLARSRAGGERVVVRVRGYQPQKISDPGIDYLINQMADVSDAQGFGYTQEGRAMYQLTFPSEGKTIVFDVSTNMWHERESTVDGEQTRHRAHCYAFFNGNHIVSDSISGKCGRLRLDLYTEYGNTVQWERMAPEIYDDEKGRRFPVSEIEIEMETGVGTAGEPSPVVMLSYSNDSGKTWSNPRMISVGKMGEYKKRAQSRRFGTARRWLFRLRGSDAVETVIKEARIK